MVLEVNQKHFISSLESDSQTKSVQYTDNPVSIFSSDCIKEHVDEIAIVCGIATIGAVGLSIIGKKNLLNLFTQNLKFKNLEEARNFSKNKITNVLKKKNPKEYLVIIDKDTNKIVGQQKGDKEFVKSDIFNVIRPSGHFSVEHGHPTCCTINGKPASTPLSFGIIFICHKLIALGYMY